MISDIVGRFLPATILLLLILGTWNKKRLSSFPFIVSVCVCVVMAFAIATLPDDYSIDKPRYISLFHNRFYWGFSEEYKDVGWMFYVTCCAKMFRNNVLLFFLLTATIYCFSYSVFGYRFFEKKSIYFLVMSMGCLGFLDYATNTIHSGFAIAFFLLGISSDKKIVTFVLLLCSVLLHRSMIIPFAGFMVVTVVNKRWVYYLIWVSCLLLSITNSDMGQLFDSFSMVDSRVEYYSGTIGSQFSSYKTGFRWDFLIYSIVPVIIYILLVKKCQIEDEVLSKIFNLYLFTNAVWLLAIRIAFTDRIAYLSWFLIPFITLYPIIKYPEKFKAPNALMLGLMGMFMGLNIVLMFV